MKIAVIADIHGNDLALEAVLSDIALQGIQDIVNLGDHLSGPLNAARTADLLMAANIPSVRGNHDRWLVSVEPDDMGASDRAAYAQLYPRHLDRLRSLPPTRVHRGEIFLCHATPQDDLTYWLEDLTEDGTMHMSGRRQIESFAAGFDFPVILCGHTHIARAVRLSDGRLIVNPGSVGCPAYDDDAPVFHKVETGSPDAAYAILSKVQDRWDVTFRRIPYEHMAMAELARQRGRETWANALSSGWIGP